MQVTGPDIGEQLRGRFDHSAGSGIPKHIRIRNVIIDLISNQVLLPGKKLHSEQVLCKLLDVSLGTVQRALGDLVVQGVIQREQGRGTFVATTKPSIDQVWQFHFREQATDRNLPVYTRFLGVNNLDDEGPWTTKIMPDPGGYFEILRIFNIDDQFLCFGNFVLGRTHYASLRHNVRIRQESTNLKRLIAEEYDTPTLRVSQQLRAAVIPAEVCKSIEISPKTSGLCYQVIGYTRSDQPFSFQTIWIPPVRHMLDLTNS